MASQRRPPVDLIGIRQRGAGFQVRIFGGLNPATGKQLILTGSAATEAEAIALRDRIRETHQSRRISLDAATMSLLADHRERSAARCAEIGAGFDEQRFLFSCTPDHARPCSPSGISHRYARRVGKRGIRTHLHAIRHYSATELLAGRPWSRPANNAGGIS